MSELRTERRQQPARWQLARWGRAVVLLFYRRSDGLAHLLDTGRHSAAFGQRRAEFILSRAKVVALLFAILTPLWIPLDALVFPSGLWQPLAYGRLAAGLGFAALTAYCVRATTIKQAYAALAVLFSIPSAYFLFSHAVLQNATLHGLADTMASGYAFLPFILMAGLAIFPLTMLETVCFAAPLLAVASYPVIERHAFMMPVFNALAALWLLVLVASVASLSAMSQLEFLRAQSSDMDEIKHRESALRESDERYALAMEGAGEGLWHWDVANDAAHMSRRIRAMLDISAPEPKETRRTFSLRVHPEDRKQRSAAFLDYIKGRTAFYTCEYRLLCRDGNYRWVSDHGLGKRDEKGRVYLMAGSISDITERKNREAALRYATQQAESANQAKTKFLANMSHELRTPLNAIMGFSDIIRQQLAGPVGATKYLDYAEDIYQSGRHLLDMINDILDVAKIEAGKEDLHEEIVDAEECVQSALQLVSEQAAASDIAIECDIPRNLPLLRADERKLKQILINLVSNSVKFTEPGGRIKIALSLGDDGAMRLEVIDTGIGISKEDLPKALSAFGQVDSGLNRTHQGTGLGLNLVQKLAKLHGASFDISSESGRGTTVIISFPSDRVVDREPDRPLGILLAR